MKDFKNRNYRRATEDQAPDEHPIVKLIAHLVLNLSMIGLFVYTLIYHASIDIGFRASFGAGALVMWMIFYSTQKMPLRRFIRTAAATLILGAIAFTWLFS